MPSVKLKCYFPWLLYTHCTYSYVQDFLPNTVAAFRLFLNEETGWTAAGGIFNNVSNLEEIGQQEGRSHIVQEALSVT